MKSFGSDALTNTVGVFATVGHASQDMWMRLQIGQRSSGGFQVSRPRRWTFERAGPASSVLWSDVKAAKGSLENLNSQTLANTVLAFATIQIP